jgi:WD40 repeat protein
VTFSHDSTWLASGSNNGTISIWDVGSGERLQTLEGHSSQVSSVTFSHDSTWLASASHDDTIKIWDTGSIPFLKVTKDHSRMVNSVTFSHDLTQLASASSDKTVKIWDVSSGTCIQTVECPGPLIDSIEFSHDSTQLASVSLKDGYIQIWDVGSGACLQTLELNSSHNIHAVAFSHDLSRMALSSHTYTWPRPFSNNSLEAWSLLRQRQCYYFVKVWDVSNGACLQTVNSHDMTASAMAFSHDSTRLAAASDDNTIWIWDASSGACLWMLGVNQSIRSLSFDSTGSLLHTDIGTVAINSLEISSLVNLAEIQHRSLLGVGTSLDGMWITHDGQKILWVPSEYRRLCSSVGGTTIGIGVGSGRVWTCSVDLPRAPVKP